MKNLILFLAFILISTVSILGQNKCLTTAEAKKLIESINSPTDSAEKKEIRQEFLKMVAEREKINAKISANFEQSRDLIIEANQMGERHLARVCEILKETGWLRMKQIQEDGFNAFTFLIMNNKAYQLQRELLPVLVEAGKKGFIGNPLLANLIDNIRIGSNQPQIFGTQATVKNDVIYLYPLLNEEKVDEWREIYNLSPLAAQIRSYENQYGMPLLKLKIPRAVQKSNQKKDDKNSDTALLGIKDEDNEVVSVETKLVSLNIRILTQDPKVVPNLDFTKDDFTILEDGKEQEIAFFSSVDQPFDLVLVLDFSGSTVDKRDLIKKAAQRFIEYARPNDRIAVVAFATRIQMVSELTTDKKALIKGIKDIELNGSSPIWDSVKFSYENIINKQSQGRRNAIVLMTDGDDNSPKTTFADLFEIIRNRDTTIFPVYLFPDYINSDWAKKAMHRHFQSMQMLADETGGQIYQANKIKDLNGIYEQIINDLGKVYSIGYEPQNEVRDGSWRNLTVKIKSHPELTAKTRRGYYAN
ncbi:MAG TPA: VWA domain-containing protein [Pyrinomonadaceae bacterium]|nr:VWA domain-containing protein [Pyrinomonadaceae bacterium]